MTKVAPIDQRKADHIKINLEQDVRSALTTGLENYHFTHEALPELDLDRIDSSLSLFGKKLNAPILISSMTGGTAEAETINLRLAEAAPCSPEEAKLLRIKTSVPLLVIQSTMYDVDNRPVEYGVAKQRGDRAQVEIAVVAAK